MFVFGTNYFLDAALVNLKKRREKLLAELFRLSLTDFKFLLVCSDQNA